MNDLPLVQIIVAVLGTGGIASAIYAGFRLRPENRLTTVEAADKAVIVQSSVITSLHEEIIRLREENAGLRGALAAIEERKIPREGEAP